MYIWFGIVPQGGEVFFPSFFVVIFGALCWRSFEDDFLGLLVGVMYEVLVPLWLVTLRPNLS
jgi:Na+/proline symporter